MCQTQKEAKLKCIKLIVFITFESASVSNLSFVCFYQKIYFSTLLYFEKSRYIKLKV
jgi:hypothetical protein